jgi:hypothetical protein
MAFVIGLVLFAGAIWFLYRLKARDIADCAAVLGMAPGDGRTTRGTTPEGFAYLQRAVLQGTMLGCPATIWSRSVKHPRIGKYRNRGSEFTVLELTLARAVQTPIRLQPAGVLGVLESWIEGPPTDIVPIDAAFDAAYVVHAGHVIDARAVLSASMREKILAFRSREGADLPASTAGKLSSGLVLGTFFLEGTTAAYALFGSPTKAVAEHVKAAAPILLELAR